MSRQAKLIFWDITPYSLLKVNRRYLVTCRRLLKGNMGVSRPLRMYVGTCQTTSHPKTSQMEDCFVFLVITLPLSGTYIHIASNCGTIDELEAVGKESVWSGFCTGVARKDWCPSWDSNLGPPKYDLMALPQRHSARAQSQVVRECVLNKIFEPKREDVTKKCFMFYRTTRRHQTFVLFKSLVACAVPQILFGWWDERGAYYRRWKWEMRTEFSQINSGRKETFGVKGRQC
jgi:hypothetical protein